MSLITCLLLCLSLFCSPTETTANKSAIPEYLSDWLKVSPPKLESEAWFAADYSEYEWEVAMKNGRPVAHRRDRKAEEAAALPSVLKHADGKKDERGEVHAIKVNDGWLVDYNAGEWGGSLWWYSADGQQRYKISNDQIHQFLQTPQGLFALEGLAHMGYNSGQIVQLQQNAQGKWTSVQFFKLAYTPEVGLVDSNGNFLISTTDTLVLVHPDKTQLVLLPKVFWVGFYPQSIALSPTGEIYLGMRHGVSRIYQKNHAYIADWLLPNLDVVHAKPKL